MIETIPVLCFHDISDRDSPISISPQKFENIVQYFYDRDYESIDISNFFRPSTVSSRKAVVFTFDDALSTCKTAKDILCQYNYTGNIFLSTAHVGKHNHRFSHGETIPKIPILPKSDLLSFKQEGWEIHAHSHTHKLEGRTKDAIRSDIVKNKNIIRDVYASYDTKHMAFCYPYNNISTVSRQVVKEEFVASFNGGNRVYTSGCNPFEIPRIEPIQKTSLFYFKWIYLNSLRGATRNLIRSIRQ